MGTSNGDYLRLFGEIDETIMSVTPNFDETSFVWGGITNSTEENINWLQIIPFGVVQKPYLQAYAQTGDVKYLRVFENLFLDYFENFPIVADSSPINIRLYAKNSSRTITFWCAYLYHVSTLVDLEGQMTPGWIDKLVKFWLHEIVPAVILHNRYTVTNHRISGMTMLLEFLQALHKNNVSVVVNDVISWKKMLMLNLKKINSISDNMLELVDDELNDSDRIATLDDTKNKINEIKDVLENFTFEEMVLEKAEFNLVDAYFYLAKEEILRNYSIRIYKDGSPIEYGDIGHSGMDVTWVTKNLRTCADSWSESEFNYLTRVCLRNLLFLTSRYQPNGYGYRLLEDYRNHRSYLVDQLLLLSKIVINDEVSRQLLKKFCVLVKKMYQDMLFPQELQHYLDDYDTVHETLVKTHASSWFPERGMAYFRTEWSSVYPGYLPLYPMKYAFAEIEGGWNNITQNYPGVVRGNVNFWTDGFPIATLPVPQIDGHTFRPWDTTYTIAKNMDVPAWTPTGIHVMRDSETYSVAEYELVYRSGTPGSNRLKVQRQVLLQKSTGILFVEDTYPDDSNVNATYLCETFVRETDLSNVITETTANDDKKLVTRTVQQLGLFCYNIKVKSDENGFPGLTEKVLTALSNKWSRFTSDVIRTCHLTTKITNAKKVSWNFHGGQLLFTPPIFTISGVEVSGFPAMGTNNRVSLSDLYKKKTTYFIANFSEVSRELLFEYLNGKQYDYVPYETPSYFLSTNSVLPIDNNPISFTVKEGDTDIVLTDLTVPEAIPDWEQPTSSIIIEKGKGTTTNIFRKYAIGTFSSLDNIEWEEVNEIIAEDDTYTLEYKWGTSLPAGTYTVYPPTEWINPFYMSVYCMYLSLEGKAFILRKEGTTFVLNQDSIVEWQLRIQKYSRIKSSFDRNYGFANLSNVNFPIINIKYPDDTLHQLN